MKIIEDKETFNALLVSNKDKALEMLKDDEGNYLEEVQIGNVNYKIFQHLPDSLLTELTDERLPEDSNPPFTNNYAGFVIGSIDFRKGTIKRTNFYWWYFIDRVNFESADFLNEVNFVYVNFFSDVNFSRANFSETSFGGAKFLSNGAYDKVDFSNAEFRKRVSFNNATLKPTVNFEYSKFLGDGYFENAIFERYVSFIYAKFKGEANFTSAEFMEASFNATKFDDIANFMYAEFSKELNFYNTIFKDRCYLEVEHFGHSVDFRGTEVRGAVFIDGAKLCKDDYPAELIVKEKGEKINNKETKKNILAVKQICNKMAKYEDEDHFYYWYKVFDREDRYKGQDGKLKERKKLLKYWLWENLFLDKLTRYFTDPVSVFCATARVFVFFGILYCLPICSIKGPNGKLLWENLRFSLQHWDNVWLFIEHVGKSFYFNAITFATVGYGDYQPVNFWAMFFSSIEGVFGVFLMATLVITLTRKFLR